MRIQSLCYTGLAGLLSFMTACSSGSGTATTTENTAQSVTVSASLTNSASDYRVLLVSSDEQAATDTQTAADATTLSSNNHNMVMMDGAANMSTTISNGKYHVVLLDLDNSPIAMLVQNGSTTIDITANTNLGTLTLDLANYQMTASSLPASDASKTTAIDLSDLVQVDPNDDGTANSVNLNTLYGNTNADDDGDKVPDFFDNDSNDNGVFDSNEVKSSCLWHIDAVAGDDTNANLLKESCLVVFDNLKLNSGQIFGGGDGDSKPYTNQHILTMELQVPSALASRITSVKATKVPAFADGTISAAAGGFTLPSYPTAGTAWSASSYALVKGTNLTSNNVYTIWISPATNKDPVPTVFHFEVVLDTGTTARVISRLMYVFNTPPLATNWDDGSGSTAISLATAGTSSANPITFNPTGSTLTMTASRALSHAGGVDVRGMGLNAHIFYLRANGTQINTGAYITSALADTDYSNPLSLPLSIATDLPATYNSETVASYQIDVTAVGTNGDNSAELLYFSRAASPDILAVDN